MTLSRDAGSKDILIRRVGPESSIVEYLNQLRQSERPCCGHLLHCAPPRAFISQGIAKTRPVVSLPGSMAWGTSPKPDIFIVVLLRNVELSHFGGITLSSCDHPQLVGCLRTAVPRKDPLRISPNTSLKQADLLPSGSKYPSAGLLFQKDTEGMFLGTTARPVGFLDLWAYCLSARSSGFGPWSRAAALNKLEAGFSSQGKMDSGSTTYVWLSLFFGCTFRLLRKSWVFVFKTPSPLTSHPSPLTSHA